MSSCFPQDYQRIFEELYPHRRPLYLTPRNECNVHKLVCTTIRPTQLSFTGVYEGVRRSSGPGGEVDGGG